jgi:hypothetical protein
MKYKSLKEIMAEQAAEKKAKEDKEKAERIQAEIKELTQKKEKVYYTRVQRLAVYDKPRELYFLNDETDTYYNIDRVITSLLIPENRNKPKRYIDCYSIKPVPEAQDKSIFDLIAKDYVYFTLDRMYTTIVVLGWIEDGLYKGLEFNSTRCPSGYCDGESVHLLVAMTAKELVEMIENVDISPASIEKIEAAFEQLPNKERIIKRTKIVKEEMMMKFWHPDRYHLWGLLDGDDDL